MLKLRLLPPHPAAVGHDGEALTCAYAPDGRKVISGGWDGNLRVWNTDTGSLDSSTRASNKPICACAVSPDGAYYLSACLDGFLAHWKSATLEKSAYFLAHWRPVSSIAFGARGQLLATSSWDKNLVLRDLSEDQDWRTLAGHKDIVGGCRFTPDGSKLLSWSHDGSLILWDVARGQPLVSFTGHGDRVTAAAISPDGRLAASGSRDRTLRLWDLENCCEAAWRRLGSDIVGCFFLADQERLAVIDSEGCLSVHLLPELLEQCELLTDLPVVGGDMSPLGNQIALGCADGVIRLVDIEGLAIQPLRTPARPAPLEANRGLRHWLTPASWKTRLTFSCPVCHLPLSVPQSASRLPVACPSCQRLLRLECVASN